MDKTNFLTKLKLLLETILILLTVTIVLLFIFKPVVINSLLVKAGFEEGTVLGFKWKNKEQKVTPPVNENPVSSERPTYSRKKPTDFSDFFANKNRLNNNDNDK